MEGVAATRGLKTVKDMVLSMALIGLGAWFLYLFVPHDEQQDPVKPLRSYRAELITAGRTASYPVLAPVGLDEGWRATSVSFDRNSDYGATWHLGFHDADVEYAAVEQSDGDPRLFVAKVTHDAVDTGATTEVDGEEWARYEGDKYDALVLREGEFTTVVTGTADFARLAELAAALEPHEPESAPSVSPE
ncbi:DUF4245 domain-containing protein [Streptomyces sp. JJ38]|uniref:DUF4245 domain-containing protein n=1 Tax=Streptomyces sp. JJ38 TaxID=2738128 RepID=UPI001C55E0A4|nr:DUF4245 domain-containing protein [Streptomyces sp. JJ38]